MDQTEDLESVEKVHDRDNDDIYFSLRPDSNAYEGPITLEAGLEESSQLSLLLEKAQQLDEEDRIDVLDQIPEPDLWGGMDLPTPLLRAIEEKRDSNVRLLLHAGASPDGVPLDVQIQLSRMGRRFTSRTNPHPASLCNIITEDQVCSIPYQTLPLSEHELEERRRRKLCSPFWTKPHRYGINYSSGEAKLHSIVCAGVSTAGVLDQLLEHHADATFWREPGNSVKGELPEEQSLSPSALAISTPLHSAIAHDNMAMLRAFLERGFDPNARAIVTGSLAISAVQCAAIIGHHGAFSTLKAHHNVRMDLTTPVFKAHSLHFAAAILREDFLESIGLQLDVPVTALGQTPLLVARLPYRAEEIHYCPKILESIHDMRSLRKVHLTRCSSEDTETTATKEKQSQPQDGGLGSLRDVNAEKDKQEKICKRLVTALYAEQITVADIHGNTALHYLAGSVFVNESLITWLRSQADGEQVWKMGKNLWDHTPKDLWDEALSVKDSEPVRVPPRMACINGGATLTGGWNPELRGRWSKARCGSVWTRGEIEEVFVRVTSNHLSVTCW